MSTPATNSNIPNPGVPFLDANGRISQVWWAFLLAIFQRTGGAGTPPQAITVDDILGLETLPSVPLYASAAEVQALALAVEQLNALVVIAQSLRSDSMTEMTFSSV